MRTIIAIAVAVGVLWFADALVNNGRYTDVIKGAITALIRR